MSVLSSDRAMNHAHHVYRERRDALLKKMRERAGGGVALVPTAPEVARNRDSLFPFRHDSYFYYLSGFPEPEAVVALVADPDGDRHVLFCREKNEEREIWDGFRYGPDAAKEIFGFDEAHSIRELKTKLPDIAADRPALFTPVGLFSDWDRHINRQIADGDLLLIDAGCEFHGYASDITRTFPVNGRFTGPQKDIYELVLASQLACIDAVRPGADFHVYHKVAERVLAQGFIDLGLCSGTLDSVLESETYKQFYMHRAGHWLGMDVHDAGLYQIKGESRKLAPGMVLTVEPGAYIRPADNVPERFWNIGIRIEDDVLVTASGTENLTAAAPKTVADVIAACEG